ncbi:uncharacterized protein LOC113782344 [Coffea eugenioides]|nr:uncharacterized protein LOC113782344 [Coffea eugenioides]
MSKRYPEKTSGISFWAFLLFTFIYISIFYIFGLSPLALMNTTKFWFFISNTIILIIAADFGAFSSTGNNDYFEEYVKSTHVRIPPLFKFHNVKLVEEKIRQQWEAALDHEKPQETIKDVIVTQNSEPCEEKKLLVITRKDHDVKNIKEYSHSSKQDQVIVPKIENIEAVEEKKEMKCIRTKSDKLILAANDEKRIQRSQSERYDYDSNLEKKIEDQNEFSTLSDEELNQRVEEFIKRFNRQIRLQATRDRQTSLFHEV